MRVIDCLHCSAQTAKRGHRSLNCCKISITLKIPPAGVLSEIAWLHQLGHYRSGSVRAEKKTPGRIERHASPNIGRIGLEETISADSDWDDYRLLIRFGGRASSRFSLSYFC